MVLGHLDVHRMSGIEVDSRSACPATCRGEASTIQLGRKLEPQHRGTETAINRYANLVLGIGAQARQRTQRCLDPTSLTAGYVGVNHAWQFVPGAVLCGFTLQEEHGSFVAPNVEYRLGPKDLARPAIRARNGDNGP